MGQDLDKVRGLARDLRHDEPRDAMEPLGGYVLAARAVDKCRAALVGWQGEYRSNCPLDQIWFEFSGIDYERFRTFVASGATDDDIAAWIGQQARRSRAEIEAWNRRQRAMHVG